VLGNGFDKNNLSSIAFGTNIPCSDVRAVPSFGLVAAYVLRFFHDRGRKHFFSRERGRNPSNVGGQQTLLFCHVGDIAVGGRCAFS